MDPVRNTAEAPETMNLYHWSSTVLENWSKGGIIVMAENVEQARDKVYAQFKPLEDGNPFEDFTLQIMHVQDDGDYQTEYTDKLNELRKDLNQEPAVIESGVVLIRGSD